MNRTNTDHITIGRDISLTYFILVAIHNRRVREATPKALIQKLRFWKRP